jgi:hypothetical protein
MLIYSVGQERPHTVRWIVNNDSVAAVDKEDAFDVIDGRVLDRVVAPQPDECGENNGHPGVALGAFRVTFGF